MKTRVINIFGGPGSGKSTTRAGLFSLLKLEGTLCEEAPEWCKAKVYEENPYVFTDQIYVFAKQRKQLKQLLGKVALVITDSPLLLSITYDNTYNVRFAPLVLSEFKSFDNINILLQRTKVYSEVGRNQNEAQAISIDEKVELELKNYAIPYYQIPGDRSAPKLIRDLLATLIPDEFGYKI